MRPVAATPKLLFSAVLCLSLLAGLQGTDAQETREPLAENANWSAHGLVRDGNKICYMYAHPSKSKGDYKRRGVPNVMVALRQGARTTQEVSVTSGYPYPKGKAVKVTIDGRQFNFDLIHREHAWVRDEGADITVVRAMIRGRDMKVRGVSLKNTYSEDSYSLMGFTEIYDAIVEACP